MRLQDLPPHLRIQAIRQMNGGFCKGAKNAVSSPSSEMPTTSRGKRRNSSEGGKSCVCNASLGNLVSEVCGNGVEKVFITLNVNPRELPTAQQKGVDFKHRIFFTKPKVKAWENRLASIFEKCVSTLFSQNRFLASEFCKHGVEVEIRFYFPYPSSTPKSQSSLISPMLKRPDCDNLAKGVLDAMTKGGIITDDNCVFSLKLEKWFLPSSPKVDITIAKRQ